MKESSDVINAVEVFHMLRRGSVYIIFVLNFNSFSSEHEPSIFCYNWNSSCCLLCSRFRILVLADDTTHACNLVLMDRVVKHIAGTTTTNILNEMKKVGFIARNDFVSIPAFMNTYVPCLATYCFDFFQSPSGAFISDLYGKIVGKEISVKIDLTEANLNGDNNIYEAVDIFDPSVQQRGAVEVSSSLFIQSGVCH